MTGDQVPAPSSPRDGDDAAINLERPKVLVCVLSFAVEVLEVFRLSCVHFVD